MRRPRIAHRFDGCGHLIRCPDGYLTSVEVTEILGVDKNRKNSWLARLRTVAWYDRQPYRGRMHAHRCCYVPVPLVQYITLAFAFEIHLERLSARNAVPAAAIKHYARGSLGERLFAIRAVEVNLSCLLELVPDFPSRVKLSATRDQLREVREQTIQALREAPVPCPFGGKARRRSTTQWHDMQAFDAERRDREMEQHRKALEDYLAR